MDTMEFGSRRIMFWLSRSVRSRARSTGILARRRAFMYACGGAASFIIAPSLAPRTAAAFCTIMSTAAPSSSLGAAGSGAGLSSSGAAPTAMLALEARPPMKPSLEPPPQLCAETSSSCG